MDVLDAGILPLVWTDIQSGLDGQVDPQEPLSQHRVCSGLDVEITCSDLSYHHQSLSLPIFTLITQAVLTRGPHDEAGDVDVGVGEAERHLPVGSGENIINIEVEAHPTSHWVDCPQ